MTKQEQRAATELYRAAVKALVVLERMDYWSDSERFKYERRVLEYAIARAQRALPLGMGA